MAFTLWGFYDPDPPTELVATRQSMFTGVEHVEHRYEQARAIVDRVPEATLRMSHQAVEAAYPTRWKELISAVSAAR